MSKPLSIQNQYRLDHLRRVDPTKNISEEDHPKLDSEEFDQALEKLRRKKATGDITSINFENLGLTDLESDIVAEIIEDNPKIKNIRLRGNKFGDDAIKALLEKIQTRPDINLTDSLGQPRFYSNGNLITTKGIEVLDLSNNDFGNLALNESVPWLLYYNASTLTEIRIGNVSSAKNKPELTESLSEQLNYCEKLEVLDFSGIIIGASVDPEFQDALVKLTTLKEIYLSSCEMGDDAAQEISAALMARTNKNLESLDLSNNKFTSQGLTKLLPVLSANAKTLKRIGLAGSGIGLSPDLTKEIAASLATSEDLEHLDLSKNKIGNGILALGPVLEKNTSLKKLYLAGNDIDDNLAADLASKLEAHKNLEVLNLSNNKLGIAGINSLLPVLQKNKSSLEELRLGKVKIGNDPELAKAFIRTLSTTKYLQVLDLSGAEIGDDVAVKLAQALKSCPYLKKINVSSNAFDNDDKAVEAFVELAKYNPWLDITCTPGSKLSKSLEKKKFTAADYGKWAFNSANKLLGFGLVLGTSQISASRQILGYGDDFALSSLETWKRKGASRTLTAALARILDLPLAPVVGIAFTFAYGAGVIAKGIAGEEASEYFFPSTKIETPSKSPSRASVTPISEIEKPKVIKMKDIELINGSVWKGKKVNDVKIRGFEDKEPAEVKKEFEKIITNILLTLGQKHGFSIADVAAIAELAAINGGISDKVRTHCLEDDQYKQGKSAVGATSDSLKKVLVDLKNSGNLVGSDWRELEDGEFVTKENRVINLGLLGLKEVVKDFSEDFQKECLKCGITGGPNNGKKPGFCLTGVPEASIEKLKNLSAPPPPGITSINLNVIKINEPLSNPDAAKIVEDAKKALKQREKELKPKQASRQK